MYLNVFLQSKIVVAHFHTIEHQNGNGISARLLSECGGKIGSKIVRFQCAQRYGQVSARVYAMKFYFRFLIKKKLKTVSEP